ncbi:nicotinamide riboside kinase 1 [Coniochaeta ligniaria NRRL 30616]|uniref:Nicotinamide riboside kinase 1 n=1 Tax=Coniochaeta ligniaria NRRL 30616 TaxID=1408157 RepID=A0A1J7J9J1_9PEZI|nr:nicotinamide riboside kinase 1 [Coniochaeta ligniaria NRRL 30616]
MEDKKAIVVGISGCSSSGKTTLARLLRDIFSNTFILHEDDFYKPEEQLPVKDGLVDWDCAEAISVPDMEAALRHIHQTGTFPTFIASKEDQNTIGACPVPDSAISAQKARVASWLGPGQPGRAVLASGVNICLLDGFLLYTPAVAPVMAGLDIKLFLLVSRSKATRRREARDGYVTLEGFWKDPPGYVDHIVWPNYAESHAWLFEEGDVEGRLRKDVLRENGIQAQVGSGLDVDMSTTLEWAVGVIMGELERLVLGKGES